VGFDQFPVDRILEQSVDVLVGSFLGWPEKHQIVPVADTGHQLNAQQVGQREDGSRLSLGIRVDSIRLDVGLVLLQPLDDVDGLPDAAGNEVAEQGHIVVGNVVIGNAAVSDVVLRQ